MSIARPDDVRRENMRSILSALRRCGALSRTEIAGQTELSASTVTAITSGLIQRGVLVEAAHDDARPGALNGNSSTRRGRPRVALSLNPRVASVAILTISLNRITVAIIDYLGVLLEQAEVSPQDAFDDHTVLMTRLGDALDFLLERHGGQTGFSHIAVALQGSADSAGRTMLWSPATSVRMVDIAGPLEARFGVDVTVANDANMIAAALRHEDPEQFGDSFAAILMSYGIGMGLFLRGELFTGVESSAAEFGHMCHIPQGAQCRCGRRGCIEAYAGDYAIWRNAQQADVSQVSHEPIDQLAMDRLLKRAREADGPERRAFEQAGEAIGHGIRNLFALFDPLPVAFVGHGAVAFDLMEPAITQALGRPGVGLSHSTPVLRCYPDAFRLIRSGALVTALTHLDNTVFSQVGLEARAGRHAS